MGAMTHNWPVGTNTRTVCFVYNVTESFLECVFSEDFKERVIALTV